MHINFTFNFWTVLSQLAVVIATGKFLYHVHLNIRDLVNACKTLIAEHHEVYKWYKGIEPLMTAALKRIVNGGISINHPKS